MIYYVDWLKLVGVALMKLANNSSMLFNDTLQCQFLFTLRNVKTCEAKEVMSLHIEILCSLDIKGINVEKIA